MVFDISETHPTPKARHHLQRKIKWREVEEESSQNSQYSKRDNKVDNPKKSMDIEATIDGD